MGGCAIPAAEVRSFSGGGWRRRQFPGGRGREDGVGRRRWRRRRRRGAGAVPAEDIRHGGGRGHRRDRVVGRREEELHRLESPRVRQRPAPHLLQAQQLLQLHTAAQHLRTLPPPIALLPAFPVSDSKSSAVSAPRGESSSSFFFFWSRQLPARRGIFNLLEISCSSEPI